MRRKDSKPAAASLPERAARSLDEMRRRALPFEQALLEDALDLQATLRTVVAAFVPDFADWCLVDLLDAEGVPHRVVVAHADPGHALVAEEYRAITLGAGWATPAAQAIRDRAPRMYSRLTDELLEWATWDARHLAALRATIPNSLMAVPLVARGASIGALTLLRSGKSPPFWGDDIKRAVALAVPSALALDIARRCARAMNPLSPTGGEGRVRGRPTSSPPDRKRRKP
jgi:GAF domain-containing protein